MSNYFDEMYGYLIKPDNYIAAKKIRDLLPSIETRLIQDFWEKFKVKFSQGVDEKWSYKIETWPENKGFTLLLSKPLWKDIAIGFDTNSNYDFVYGINLGVKSKFSGEKIRMIEEKYKEKLLTITPENKWWLCFNDVPFKNDYIFDSMEKFLTILPASRETKMLEIYSLLKRYAIEVEGICDEINTDCRKTNPE